MSQKPFLLPNFFLFFPLVICKGPPGVKMLVSIENLQKLSGSVGCGKHGGTTIFNGRSGGSISEKNGCSGGRI